MSTQIAANYANQTFSVVPGSRKLANFSGGLQPLTNPVWITGSTATVGTGNNSQISLQQLVTNGGMVNSASTTTALVLPSANVIGNLFPQFSGTGVPASGVTLTVGSQFGGTNFAPVSLSFPIINAGSGTLTLTGGTGVSIIGAGTLATVLTGTVTIWVTSVANAAGVLTFLVSALIR